MSPRPLVSIITPAYNRADLLAETIDSVLNQDYPALEYIVLDDGSRDATLEVIKRYDGRVRWDSHPNMGETCTVNKGFAMATGDIIGVVNSDDPLLPGAVQRVVEVLTAHPNVMVVYPDWNLIDEGGRVLQPMMAYDFTSYVDMVRKHHCLPGPGAFFRRKVVEMTGGRDPQFRFVADLDFWFHAGLLGDLVRIPEVLATWRRHSGAATVCQQGGRMAEEHLILVEKLFARTDLPEAVRQIEREAKSSAWYVAGSVYGKGCFAKKLHCFSHALRLAPLKYFGEYIVRWPIIVTTIFNIPYLKVYYVMKKVEDHLRRRSHA